MGHVGQEFGFVLTGQFKVSGFGFELLLSDLDFRIFLFDVCFLFSQVFRFFLQFFVGGLKLFALAFELFLGLFEYLSFFLQFLIGGLEFFLLLPQSLRLPLRLGQKRGHFLPILGGIDGDGDVFSYEF